MESVTEFKIYTLGSDGKHGGSGAAEDIDKYLNAKTVYKKILNGFWGCNA
jgi:hypothetical protein